MNFKSLIVLMLTSLFLSSCELAKGIFNAGFWSGIILVAVIIFAIIYFIGKSRKGN